MTLVESTSLSFRISVLIPTFNRLDILPRALQALENQILIDQKDYEVIVVDDGSTDGTQAFLKEYAKRTSLNFRYLIQDINSGPAAARNRAIGEASGEYILITGDDIIATPAFLFTHLSEHLKYNQEEVAVLGYIAWPPDLPLNTVMRHIDGVGGQQFSYQHFGKKIELDWRHFYTSNISINRNWYLSTGHSFREDFPNAAFEDCELGYRLSKQGLRIMYCAKALAYHYHPYTVWSFAERTRKVGKMGAMLLKMHPELLSELPFGEVLAPSNNFLMRCVVEVLQERDQEDWEPHLLENLEIALRVAGSYEQLPVDGLDDYYIALFQYLLLDGFVESALRSNPQLDKESSRIRLYLQQFFLVEGAYRFSKRMEELNLPKPSADMKKLLDQRFTEEGEINSVRIIQERTTSSHLKVA